MLRSCLVNNLLRLFCLTRHVQHCCSESKRNSRETWTPSLVKKQECLNNIQYPKNQQYSCNYKNIPTNCFF